VSEHPSALYDDLGVAPDSAFETALRNQLEVQLQDTISRATPYIVDNGVDVDVPLTATPEVGKHEERGRSRRSLVAVAAAIVASVGAGLLVADPFRDDSTQQPALTRPLPTRAPTTVGVTVPAPTTDKPSLTADELAGIRTLLWTTDYDLPGFVHGDRPAVTLDAAVAEQLPACRPFMTTVFESARRPAAVKYRLFYNQATGMLAVHYVTVHPTVSQAAAMLDAMQDPAFLNECVPAYDATLPVEHKDRDPWFPFYVAHQMTPPVIDVDADDVWVRRFDSMWTDDQGVLQYGPEEVVTVVIRVGRIVASIDVMLIDSNGRQIATVEDVTAIVDRMAERAAAAQG
jgi:hypothetical protein